MEEESWQQLVKRSLKSPEEIARFFRVYKGPEEKDVVILGWEGAESAKREIKEAQELFKSLRP